MNHGALPYNRQYEQAHLEGAPRVELVALPNVPNNYLSLTPKNNIMTLWNQRTQDETFLCEKSLTSHYDVDFIANMFYGEQYRSINKEMLCVARLNGVDYIDEEQAFDISLNPANAGGGSQEPGAGEGEGNGGEQGNGGTQNSGAGTTTGGGTTDPHE